MSLLFGGQNWFSSLLHYRISTRMIWRTGLIEKWTLGGMDASENWMIFQFTTYQATTLSLSSKKCSSNHPCCSGTSPKQQWRYLPSLLYTRKSFFYCMPKEAAKELDNFKRKKIIIGWIVNPKTNFSLLEGKTHSKRLKSEMGENFKYIEIGRGGEDKKG